MDKNQPARRKGLFDMRDVKRLVFVLALSSTLGFWALFSNKINLNSFVAASSSPTAVSDPPSQPVDVLVVELQPIPTLIPTSGPYTPSLAQASVPTQTPVSSAPVQIVINAPPSGGNTQKSFASKSKERANKPAAVTTTSSS